MDRLAQTALSAIRQMRDNKFDLAHNLSNVNVPGFRRDLPNEGNAAFLKELDKVSAKVLPLEVDRRSFSNEAGPLQNTGLATDVAVLNEGFFFIAPENGEIALSRRGDFGIDALNQLDIPCSVVHLRPILSIKLPFNLFIGHGKVVVCSVTLIFISLLFLLIKFSYD